MSKTLKKGEICSFRSYLEVVNQRHDYLEVKDVETGQEFSISGEKLIERIDSSLSFDKEEKLPKTALALAFDAIDEKPFTVCFLKKDETARELSGKKSPSTKTSILGYSSVIDLNLPCSAHRKRLVNHNSLQWFICDGVKYSLK